MILLLTSKETDKGKPRLTYLLMETNCNLHLDQSVCLPACPSLCSVSCPTIKCVSPHETSQCSLPAGFSVAVCWLFSFDSEASRHSTSLRGPSPWLHKRRMTASGGPSATCLKRSMCGFLHHPLRHPDYEIMLLNTCNHVILLTGASMNNMKLCLSWWRKRHSVTVHGAEMPRITLKCEQHFIISRHY